MCPAGGVGEGTMEVGVRTEVGVEYMIVAVYLSSHRHEDRSVYCGMGEGHLCYSGLGGGGLLLSYGSTTSTSTSTITTT